MNLSINASIKNGAVANELMSLQKRFLCLPWQSVKRLSNLISSLEILEPQNPELFYRMSLAFTRVVRRFSLFSIHS